MTLEYVLKNMDLHQGRVNVRTDVQFDVLAGAFVGGEEIMLHYLSQLQLLWRRRVKAM